MRRHPGRTASFVVVGLLCLAGCAGNMKSTKYTHPEFDFSYVERVAVLPFENLSNDRQAGFRATRLTVTELLASGTVDVVEPGEVQAAQLKIQGGQAGRAGAPNSEQILSLGKALGVQAIVTGNVSQSESIRAGSVLIPVVTLDAHMIETETGSTVWAATHTEKGGSTGAKVLGTGGEPISQTTRRCVKKLLETLID